MTSIEILDAIVKDGMIIIDHDWSSANLYWMQFTPLGDGESIDLEASDLESGLQQIYSKLNAPIT